MKDGLSGINALKALASYKFFIPLLIAVVLLIPLLLSRTKHKGKKLFSFLNYLAVILFLFQTGLLAQSFFSSSWQDMPTIALEKTDKKPNVYFILFDEYCGNQQMEDWYGFENERLKNYFASKGILNRENFRSNYNWTMLSMNSMLNLQYVDKDLLYPWNEYSLYLKSYRYIGDNQLVKFFEKNDYDFKNLSIFNIADKKQEHRLANQYSAVEVMNNKMLFQTMKGELAWHFIVGKFKTDYLYEKEYLYHLHKNEKVLSETIRYAKEASENSKSQFVYSHMMLPHQPYLTDSNGMVLDYDTELKKFGTNAAYFNNVIVANRKIQTFYDSILHYDPESIVILSGDHGFRSLHDSIHPYVFSTLFSMHLPSESYEAWDSVSSLVNVFPTLLNSEFNQKVPIYKDSTFFMDEKTKTFFPYNVDSVLVD